MTAGTLQRVVHSAPDWQAYTPAEMSGGVDLVRDGALPRVIVMIEAGVLLVTNAAGDPRPMPALPAGYAHPGAARSIMPGQPAAVAVYW